MCAITLSGSTLLRILAGSCWRAEKTIDVLAFGVSENIRQMDHIDFSAHHYGEALSKINVHHSNRLAYPRRAVIVY